LPKRVVVLPGILGSTLADGQSRLVWSPTAGAAVRAIATLNAASAGWHSGRRSATILPAMA
jgi:hypothetical protein